MAIIIIFLCHPGCVSVISKKNSLATTSTFKSDAYDVYFSGSDINVKRSTKAALLLVGGGDNDIGAMDWFLRQGDFGDVVIIRGSGSDGYNSYLLEKGANSVTSIVIKSRKAASDIDVLQKIRGAEIIFFAGGDQSDYARNLTDTPLAREIEASARRGVPVGGNSAGLAILGQFYFPAYKDTITSSQSLPNPGHERLILEKNLLKLPFLGKLITDSHFQNRDRMGRLLTFMARILCDNWSSSIRGVGLDENVALAISRTGVTTVYAKNGLAYLLESNTAPLSCQKSDPLTFEKVIVRKLRSGDTFDFNNWNTVPAPSYNLDVRRGVIHSSAGSIY